MSDDHIRHMSTALQLAERAAQKGEVPVGAILLHGESIIGTGFNRRIGGSDPTAHAEIEAIRQGAQKLGDWRLSGSTMYVTLEPCAMCAGALVNARVSNLVFGCTDPKGGAVRSLYRLCEDPRLNHRVNVVGGVLAEHCATLLREFFAGLRAERQKRPAQTGH